MAALLASALGMVAAASSPARGAPAPGISATGTPVWTKLSPAKAPAPLTSATMAYDPASHQLLLFGGQGANNFDSSETWNWNGTTWTELSPATSPPPLAYATMTYDAASGDLVLFGGWSDGTYESGTWIWNGTTWASAAPSSKPSARIGADMAYDPSTSEIVLFGGFNGAEQVSDTWTWNGTTWNEPSLSTIPGPRYQSAMAYDAATNDVVMFGGSAGGGVGGLLNDTWTWNGTAWASQSPASSPPARYSGTMDDDTSTSQLVLFGGNGASDYLGDTWTWTGTNWTALSPAASPSARAYSAMAYDASTSQLIVFGGENNQLADLNDTWTFGTATVPGPPGSLTAAAGDEKETLDWSAPTSDGGTTISGYNVYDGTKSGQESTKPVNPSPLPASTRTYTKTGLANGTRVYFVVKAVNAIGVGPPSNQASAIPATVPAAPGSLTATAGSGKITLSWKTPTSDGGSAITGYNVYDGTKSGQESTKPVNSSPLSASTHSYTKTGLKSGTREYFVVKAVNAAGVGPPSNQASAIPS
jgi:hypothetical protein